MKLAMSVLNLYDYTCGCWERKIESVESAEYALATYKGNVVEVGSHLRRTMI